MELAHVHTQNNMKHIKPVLKRLSIFFKLTVAEMQNTLTCNNTQKQRLQLFVQQNKFSCHFTLPFPTLSF